jgi:Lrp/AsnC family transcriptional regulator, leucine-responsive regulatory protein
MMFRMPTRLDDVDHRLLAAVQADARLPQAALGARVGLSAAAVNRRLRRLTKDGYITRTTAVLAPELLGHPLTVIAQVEVESEQTAQLDQVQAAFVSCPEVQQCYNVTGECDFVLVFLVRDMQQYLGLTGQLFYANANVKRFRTLVVMDRTKVTLDVPLG